MTRIAVQAPIQLRTVVIDSQPVLADMLLADCMVDAHNAVRVQLCGQPPSKRSQARLRAALECATCQRYDFHRADVEESWTFTGQLIHMTSEVSRDNRYSLTLHILLPPLA